MKVYALPLIALIFLSVVLPCFGSQQTRSIDSYGRVSYQTHKQLLLGINYMKILDTREEVGGFRAKLEHLQEIKSWGLNSVRLGFTWWLVEPTKGTYDETYLGYIDTVVKWCKQVGLRVILNMMQYHWSWWWAVAHGFESGIGMPKWVDKKDFWSDSDVQQAWRDVWKMLAQRYADEPTVVGIDPLNEPNCYIPGETPEFWDQELWVKMNSYLVADIRTVSPNVTIFAEIGRWSVSHFIEGGSMNDATRVGPLEDENVVYSTHWYHYPWKEIGIPTEDDLKNFFEPALNFKNTWNISMWASEFGNFHREANLAQAVETHEALLNLLRKEQIGWAYWTYEEGLPSEVIDFLVRNVS